MNGKKCNNEENNKNRENYFQKKIIKRILQLHSSKLLIKYFIRKYNIYRIQIVSSKKKIF